MGRAGTFVAGVLLATAPSFASANLGEGGVRLPSRDPGTPGPTAPAPPGFPPEAEGIPEPGDDDPGPLPLFPRLPLARAAGWLLPPEPQPSDREEEAEANLERYFDEALDRDRLDAGQVDGWYHEVGREMRQRFRPDQGRIESERRRGMTLLQVLWDELRRYAGGPERPQDVPGQYTPEMRGGTALTTDPTDRRAAVEQEEFDHCNALNAPVTWYRVDLRVTHNPEGELSAAWVHRSSGLDNLDRAALEAARSGAADLPAPPANVVGDRQAIQSDWAFEFGDVATPLACMTNPMSPTPIVPIMCVDDPIRGVECAVFGRGIMRTRVRLLGVVDADHPTPEERRAARRRERLDIRPRPE